MHVRSGSKVCEGEVKLNNAWRSVDCRVSNLATVYGRQFGFP